MADKEMDRNSLRSTSEATLASVSDCPEMDSKQSILEEHRVTSTTDDQPSAVGFSPEPLGVCSASGEVPPNGDRTSNMVLKFLLESNEAEAVEKGRPPTELSDDAQKLEGEDQPEPDTTYYTHRQIPEAQPFIIHSEAQPIIIHSLDRPIIIQSKAKPLIIHSEGGPLIIQSRAQLLTFPSEVQHLIIHSKTQPLLNQSESQSASIQAEFNRTVVRNEQIPITLAPVQVLKETGVGQIGFSQKIIKIATKESIDQKKSDDCNPQFDAKDSSLISKSSINADLGSDSSENSNCYFGTRRRSAISITSEESVERNDLPPSTRTVTGEVNSSGTSAISKVSSENELFRINNNISRVKRSRSGSDSEKVDETLLDLLNKSVPTEKVTPKSIDAFSCPRIPSQK